MEQQKQKTRGTIILDACALMQMEDDRVDLLSIFGALSRHGFDVLIPETIAVESNATLADGTDLEQFFSHNVYKHREIKSLIRSAAHNSELPNLRIVSQTGPEAADVYCSALKRGAEKGLSAAESRALVASAHQQYKLKDLGDDAILSLATRIREGGETLPIFVLTNDSTFRERLNEAHIENLSSRCFSNCLSEAKIDQALGLTLTRHHIREGNNHFKGRIHGIDKAILAKQPSHNAQVEGGQTATGDSAVGLSKFTKRFGTLGRIGIKPSTDHNGGNGGVGGASR